MQGFPPRLLAVSERCPPAMLRKDFWSINDFVLINEVGSGAASTVYYAVCRKSCLPLAVKMYVKSKLTKLNRRQVEREVNIHSSLSHPHIIDFYAAFEDDEKIYLIQEFAAGGDLFDEVKRKGGRMQEAEVVQMVLYPYLCALLYLHARGIIHRDIKPENTVFTKDHVMKVTDFGLALNMKEERPVTRLGTLDYMAPEVLRCPDKHLPHDNKERQDLEYTAAVDAWAMGVLAYELTVGRPPFGMSDRESTMRAITQLQPAIPDWLSAGASSFILSALNKTPSRRMPIAHLIQHPWILQHTRESLKKVPAMVGEPLLANATRMAPPARGSLDCFSAASLLAAEGQLHAVSGWDATARPVRRQQHTKGLLGFMSEAGQGYTAPAMQHNEPHNVAKVHDQSYWRTDGVGWGKDDILAGVMSASPAVHVHGFSTSGGYSPGLVPGGCGPGGGGPSIGSSSADGSGQPLPTAADFYRAQLTGAGPSWVSAKSPLGKMAFGKNLSRSFSVKRRTPDTHVVEDYLMPSSSSQDGSEGTHATVGHAPDGTMHHHHHRNSMAMNSPSRLSKMKRMQDVRMNSDASGSSDISQARMAHMASSMQHAAAGVPLSQLGSTGSTSSSQDGTVPAWVVCTPQDSPHPGGVMTTAAMVSCAQGGPATAVPATLRSIEDLRSHPLLSPLNSPMYSPYISRQNSFNVSVMGNEMVDVQQSDSNVLQLAIQLAAQAWPSSSQSSHSSCAGPALGSNNGGDMSGLEDAMYGVSGSARSSAPSPMNMPVWGNDVLSNNQGQAGTGMPMKANPGPAYPLNPAVASPFSVPMQLHAQIQLAQQRQQQQQQQQQHGPLLTHMQMQAQAQMQQLQMQQSPQAQHLQGMMQVPRGVMTTTRSTPPLPHHFAAGSGMLGVQHGAYGAGTLGRAPSVPNNLGIPGPSIAGPSPLGLRCSKSRYSHESEGTTESLAMGLPFFDLDAVIDHVLMQ